MRRCCGEGLIRPMRPLATSLALILISSGVLFFYLRHDARWSTEVPAASRDGDALRQPSDLTGALERSSIRTPDDTIVWSLLARQYARQGHRTKALTAQRHALALAVDHIEAADLAASFGWVLIEEGRGQVTPDARDAFAEAIKRNPAQHDARYVIGLAKLQDGDHAAALAALQRLLADTPASPSWRRQRVLARIDEARAGLRRSAVEAATSPGPTDHGPAAGAEHVTRSVTATRAHSSLNGRDATTASSPRPPAPVWRTTAPRDSQGYDSALAGLMGRLSTLGGRLVSTAVDLGSFALVCAYYIFLFRLLRRDENIIAPFHVSSLLALVPWWPSALALGLVATCAWHLRSTILLANIGAVFGFMGLLWAWSLIRRDESIAAPILRLGPLLAVASSVVWTGITPAKVLLLAIGATWTFRFWMGYPVVVTWCSTWTGVGTTATVGTTAHGRPTYGITLFIVLGTAGLFVSVPVQLAAAAPAPDPIGLLDMVAATVALFGLGYAAVADWQIERFKRRPTRPPVMDDGLWRYSQHPNVFGELVAAWGFFLFAVPEPFGLATVLVPIIITKFCFDTAALGNPLTLLDAPRDDRKPLIVPGPRRSGKLSDNVPF